MRMRADKGDGEMRLVNECVLSVEREQRRHTMHGAWTANITMAYS